MPAGTIRSRVADRLLAERKPENPPWDSRPWGGFSYERGRVLDGGPGEHMLKPKVRIVFPVRTPRKGYR